jgi:hypothetical protein
VAEAWPTVSLTVRNVGQVARGQVMVGSNWYLYSKTVNLPRFRARTIDAKPYAQWVGKPATCMVFHHWSYSDSAGISRTYNWIRFSLPLDTGAKTAWLTTVYQPSRYYGAECYAGIQ